MRRILPWLFAGIAVGVVLLLGLPLLQDRGGGGGGPDGDVPGLRGHGAAPASLAGARGARETAPAPAPAAGRYRVRGKVVDGDGEPLAGVAVGLWYEPWGSTTRELHRADIERIVSPRLGLPAPTVKTSTEADGTFEIAVAESGRHALQALVEPPRRSTREYAFFYPHVSDGVIVLHVLDGLALEGRVVDAEGRGVAAVVEGTFRDSRTDRRCEAGPTATDPESGAFTLAALLEGDWWIDLTLPGRALVKGLCVAVPHEGVWTIRLGDAAGSVVGRVTGEGGTPVAGATVLVETGDRHATGCTALSTTGADGAYAIDWIAAG